MPDASYLQTSFLGGEWSPYAQGRMDDPRYRTGMNVCRNTIPVEEGSATRRPGTRLARETRSGAFGVLRNFHFEQQQPYSLELTQGFLRFFSGAALVSSSASERFVTNASSATPAVVTVSPVHDLVTGDQVYFRMDDPSNANASLNILLGRTFTVTVVDTDDFSIVDALTGEAIDGTGVTIGDTILLMEKIVEIATPYGEADLQAINTVQDQTHLLLLHGSYIPYLLRSTAAATGDAYAVFNFSPADLLDGPYKDPVQDGAVITASGTTGSVTLTISGGTTRWVSTDVGRLVRLFYAPADWSNVTAYTTGQTVGYNGAYYVALRATTGDQPDQSVEDWGVDVNAARWTWAEITAVSSATVATATIRGEPLIAVAPAISTWRLGLYSETTGYPTCGVYHENRLWLTGVQGNRIDGSKVLEEDGALNFEPTSPDGTVADDNACQYVFAATDVNKIFWMVTDNKGIVCGTQAGEWVVQASQQNDPLTPTSVQAHRYTDYGCADVQARRAGLAVAFVQRHQKKVQEYITTDSRGFAARNISITGKHLTGKDKVVEIAYVRELAPVVWARTEAGALIGCTYKRESPFASEPADFAGWHRHDLGSGHSVVSIQAGPSFNGDLDALSLITVDPDTGYHYVSVLTDIFDENNEIGDSYFVDMGIGPAMYDYAEGVSLILYGLWRLEGETIAAFIAGIDMGDFTVANGTITIPIGAANSLLTTAWINGLSSGTNFRGFGLTVGGSPTLGNPPAVDGIANITPPVGSTGGYSYTVGYEAVDWDNRRVYTYRETVRGLRSIDLDTQTQIKETVRPSVLSISVGMVVDKTGRLLFPGFGGNTSVLERYNPDTLLLTATFGAGGGSGETDATHWSTPRAITPVKSGDRNFLVSGSTSLNEVAVLDLDYEADGVTPGMSWTGFKFDVTEGDSVFVCPGRSAGSSAVAYALGRSNGANGAGGASAMPLGIYRVLVNQAGEATHSKLGTVTVPDMFTDWKHYSDIRGMVGDETPGAEGVIININYSNAAAWNSGDTYLTPREVVAYSGRDYANLVPGQSNHQPDVSPTFWEDLGPSFSSPSGAFRLMKVLVPSCEVAWYIDIINFSGNPTIQHGQTRVRHGHLAFFEPGELSAGVFRLRDIDTVTGVSTTRNIAMGDVGYQFYNDYTGDLIFFSGWSGHDTTPPVGSTSPVQRGAAASFSNQLAILGHGTGPFLPAADPPANDAFLGIPVALGFTYTSQGQILRPIIPQESGAANGPALAKTRRSHMAGVLMHKTQGITFGTVFSKLRPGQFRSPGGTPFPLTTLWSGIYWNTLEDDYSFDSMICWEITRPYPATVLTIGAFVETQDR